eukprot:2558796-Amphidinium_carterae.1
MGTDLLGGLRQHFRGQHHGNVRFRLRRRQPDAGPKRLGPNHFEISMPSLGVAVAPPHHSKSLNNTFTITHHTARTALFLSSDHGQQLSTEI